MQSGTMLRVLAPCAQCEHLSRYARHPLHGFHATVEPKPSLLWQAFLPCLHSTQPIRLQEHLHSRIPAAVHVPPSIMAPLTVEAARLSSIYSPLSCRRVGPLPGCQLRRVPFVRPARQLGRVMAVTAPERFIHHGKVESTNGNKAFHDVEAWYSLGTKAVHSGERAGRPRVSDTVNTPIVQSSTFTFKDSAELLDYQQGRYGSYEYGRYGNPTTRVCEEKIRALEGAEDCLVSASGMNSATTMLLALVPPGGHIVTTTDCYRRTRQFIQTMLPRMGITATVLDPADMAGLEQALEKHRVTLYFSESPTNPYMRCVDIPRIAAMCHAKGAFVCIDSTFATPVNSQPLALGADLVIHSATKYLAGHNDVLAGALAGRADLVAEVRNMQKVLGGTLDPHAAYLLIRGMKTLKLRVLHQNATCMELAHRLEAHPKVRQVYYPGLESHPDHAIAKAQMSGYGGVISFDVAGDLWKTAAFCDMVRLPYMGPSLGGVESLIGQPALMTYFDMGPEGRREIGIGESLVRYSCGIEDVEDIWADLEQALDRL